MFTPDDVLIQKAQKLRIIFHHKDLFVDGKFSELKNVQNKEKMGCKCPHSSATCAMGRCSVFTARLAELQAEEEIKDLIKV